VKDRPFLVFHDAYQYLEARFGLNGQGAIVLNPETPPGARRLQEIRHRIDEAGVACVFSEPQFEIGYVRTVLEGTGARTAALDPLGVNVRPGPDAYRPGPDRPGRRFRKLSGGSLTRFTISPDFPLILTVKNRLTVVRGTPGR
jgi:hypothetical protein